MEKAVMLSTADSSTTTTFTLNIIGCKVASSTPTVTTNNNATLLMKDATKEAAESEQVTANEKAVVAVEWDAAGTADEVFSDQVGRCLPLIWWSVFNSIPLHWWSVIRYMHLL